MKITLNELRKLIRNELLEQFNNHSETFVISFDETSEDEEMQAFDIDSKENTSSDINQVKLANRKITALKGK